MEDIDDGLDVQDNYIFNQDIEIDEDEDADEDQGNIDDFPAPRHHRAYELRHPVLDGTPCDEHGFDLPPGTPPAPRVPPHRDSWAPFNDRSHFELADFLFQRNQMPGAQVDGLMHILAALYNTPPLYQGHNDLYDTIDSIPHGEVPWESLTVKYHDPNNPDGDLNPNSPPWMHAEYDVWFRNPRELLRNQLSNPDFDGEFDYTP
ncbi:hypothetical protein BJ138DRAFT_1120420 [Hygrophoropsis aurantiaca]|uniref:Uncharacterized protein n=1 Tax=Hygrophoropsis aurantiaca TaxID=72124 RepID=A0ACB7ZR77_9AGAM|nr:hypothetical protein BJ138DRAFT_1120420 [Hygrophoropsis aurantiaca]